MESNVYHNLYMTDCLNPELYWLVMTYDIRHTHDHIGRSTGGGGGGAPIFGSYYNMSESGYIYKC